LAPARRYSRLRRPDAGAYGIEIDPAYCDVTIRRLHAVCGLDPVLDATGQPFAEIEAESSEAERRARQQPRPRGSRAEARRAGLRVMRRHHV